MSKKSWWGRHAPWSFLNTPEEWHAWVFGFCEIACPWRPRWKLSTKEVEYEPWPEYHYYLFGRVCGFITLGLEIAGFLKLIEVLF